MSTLVDTNILARSAQPGHSMYQAAVDATDALRRQGEQLCLVPQNFYEFWAIATRPVADNGLGMTPAQAQAQVAQLKQLFTVLPDTPAVFPEWERLVTHYQVRGKNAHDARLVAAMNVHGVGRILTFNIQDFQRYQGITVLHPSSLLGAPPTP